MDIDALLDAERGDSEAWVPQGAGDKLTGIVVDTASHDAGHGEYPIVVVETDQGELLAFHAFHTVAKDEVRRADPKVGDTFGVKYLGRLAPKNGGNSYEGYRVAVIPAARAAEEPF